MGNCRTYKPPCTYKLKPTSKQKYYKKIHRQSWHKLFEFSTVGLKRTVTSIEELARMSPDRGVIVNGPLKSHSNIVSSSLRFLNFTCLWTHSPAAHEPMSSSLTRSILNWGSSALRGILKTFWWSIWLTSRQSSYLIFSRGRKVMGSVKVVPGLREIIFGWSVVKNRDLGTLKNVVFKQVYFE